MSVIASRQNCIMLHVDGGDGSVAQITQTDFVLKVAKTANCPIQHLRKKWLQSTDIGDLFEVIKHQNVGDDRNILLLSGAYLEEQITLCALEALAIGFDVHLLCDATTARLRQLAPTFKLRLCQAGAVPTSLRQILYMWHASETEAAIATALQKLMIQSDVIISGAPRKGAAKLS